MLRTNRHSCYDLEYHLVVATKYRKSVIKKGIRKRLFEITERLFKESLNCYINAVETDKDHIHIMFEAPPQIQLSKIANSFKTVTSRYIQKEFPEELAKYYWKPHFWSDSYFICSVSERSREKVKSYITQQRKGANPT